jgi:hypothetical protein
VEWRAGGTGGWPTIAPLGGVRHWWTSHLYHPALTSRKFGSEMERRGFRLDKSNGNCWSTGLRVKQLARDGEDDGDDGQAPI